MAQPGSGPNPVQPAAVRKRFGSGVLAGLRSVRFSRLRYMLIFSLAPIFPNMKNSLISNADQFFGLNATFAMGIAYSLGIGLVFLLAQPAVLHRVARVLSVVTALLFLGWIVSATGALTFWLGMLFSLGLGGCAGLELFGFTYALNDTERLFGAAAAVLFCMVSQLILCLPALWQRSGLFYLGAQVLVTLLCLTRFDPHDYLETLRLPKLSGAKPLAVVLFFFFAHRAIVFFYSYLPHAPASPIVGLVGIAVFLASLYVFFAYRFNTWHLCNLFFIGMSLSYLIHLLTSGEKGLLFADTLQGFGYMGYIASYYLLGTTLSHLADFKRFRMIILIIFNSSLVLHVAPGLLNRSMPAAMPLLGGLLTLAFFMIFALLSPTFSDQLFHQDVKGSEARRREIMQEHRLTAREQEIALLLLQGALLKECAASLDISVDTVKFHSKNIYRKLGINGRNELLNVFKEA